MGVGPVGEQVVLRDGGGGRPWGDETARFEDAGVFGGLALARDYSVDEAVGPDPVGLGEDADPVTAVRGLWVCLRPNGVVVVPEGCAVHECVGDVVERGARVGQMSAFK